MDMTKKNLFFLDFVYLRKLGNWKNVLVINICIWRFWCLCICDLFPENRALDVISHLKHVFNTFSFNLFLSREVTAVSSTGRTVSSHPNRDSTPHQTPRGRCHLLTTPARGCQGSRAKDSTHLACPWASTTRSVISHHSSIFLEQTTWYMSGVTA